MAGGKLISTGVEFPDATTQTTSGLPLTGGALTGAVTTTSTFDGRDVAADGVTADAALPKAGGTMTGTIAGFTSTGIDDNATSTAITLPSTGKIVIDTAAAIDTLTLKRDAGVNGTATFGFPAAGLEIDSGTALKFSVDGNEKGRFLSGGGLTFNGDTAAANALDDYEEGTWTPTINAGAVSYTAQRGRYTKIGNKVLIEGFVHINTITPTNSYSIILGLPFASSATYYSGLTTKVNGFNWGGSATMLTFQVQPSTTHISAAGAYNNGGFNDVNANGLAAGDWISVTGAYTV